MVITTNKISKESNNGITSTTSSYTNINKGERNGGTYHEKAHLEMDLMFHGGHIPGGENADGDHGNNNIKRKNSNHCLPIIKEKSALRPRPLTKTNSIENHANSNEKKNSSVTSTNSSVLTMSDFDKKTCSDGSMTSTNSAQRQVDTPVKKLYEIRKRLGKGAYGIVWEAFERETGRKVALKKIFDAFRNDTDAQRTYREIMFLREFGHHPNIISLTNVHRASNNLDIYLVFPFMENDLHKVIKYSPEQLTDETIRFITYQFLKAILFLHSADVIHRDLKPANILLDETLNVKLGDFGLARSIRSTDHTKEENVDNIMTDYIATRWYRPPEILLSCKRYTKGVDMWSVGCILAEMILLRPLFSGATTIEMLKAIMSTIEEPTHQEIEELCRGSTAESINASVIEKSMEFRDNSLDEILTARGYDTVQFMEKLLVFNPNKRLTIHKALAQPFLAMYRNIDDEITTDHPVLPPLNDDIQLSLAEYRSVIYEQIKLNEETTSLFEDSDSTPKATPMNSRPMSLASSKSSSSTRTIGDSINSQTQSEQESASVKKVIKKKRTIFTLPNNQTKVPLNEWGISNQKYHADSMENAFTIPAAKSAGKTHSLTSFSNIWTNETSGDENSLEVPTPSNFRDIVRKYQGDKSHNISKFALDTIKDVEERDLPHHNEKQRESKLSSWRHGEKSLHRPPTAPYYGDPSKLQYSVNWQNSGDGALVTNNNVNKVKITPSGHSILDGLPYLNNMKMAPPPPPDFDSNRHSSPPNFDKSLQLSPPTYESYQQQNNRHNYASSKSYNFSTMKTKLPEKGKQTSNSNIKGSTGPGAKANLGNRMDNLMAPKQNMMSRMGDMQQKINSKVGMIDSSNRGVAVGPSNSMNYTNNPRVAGYFPTGQQQQKNESRIYNSQTNHAPSKPYDRNRVIQKNKPGSTKNSHPKSYQSTWTQRNAEIEEANRRDSNNRSAYFPDSIIKVNPLITNPQGVAHPSNTVHVSKETRKPKVPQRAKHTVSSMSTVSNAKSHADKYLHNMQNSHNEATINASELYHLTSMNFSMKGKFGGNL